MPAKDIYHDHVRDALIADGWTITDDPYYLRIGKKRLPIDLGAEKLIAAQKDKELIAVEIKSFRGDSKVSDFHAALGQYLNYKINLQEVEEARLLYLAIPSFIYEELEDLLIFNRAVQHFDIKLIIFQPTDRRIKQWKK